MEPARSCLPLPIALDEIDCEWLSAALRTRTPEAVLHSFSIVDVQRGACTKLRLRLHSESSLDAAGVPQRVILKGGFEPHSREMYRMHDREVRGYRDVFPVFNLATPLCYFAETDVQRRQGIVIMEDLTLRGVTFCHPLQPLGEGQIVHRLSMLARYHAQTWGSPELGPRGRWSVLPHVAEATRLTYRAYLQAERWQRVLEQPRRAATSELFHSSAWVADVLDRLVTYSSRLPHVIVHGDTHPGNLYVDRNGTPGFLDSLPGRSPAMEEISYFLTSALDVDNRRRLEVPLVQHYLAELRAHGVDAPRVDDAMRQYALFLARGYIVFLCNESAFQSEAVNAAQVARFNDAMLDHNTAERIAGIN